MINYGRQFIDNKDIKSVVNVLKSDWLTQGPYVKKFEESIKTTLGANYTCVVNNGTAALHLACLSLDLKKGDFVLTTPTTFLASANAILYVGAIPVFIDINPKNYCVDIYKMEKKLIEFKKKRKKIKAAIVTDYAGQPCDWKKIKELSKKYNFYTINDNCHSLGSRYKNDSKYAVKFADIVTHSFHPVKVITTGEGGSLSTNNKKIFDKVNLLRTHGVNRNKFLKRKFGNWYYEMQELGYNFRLSDINAALGLSQLKKLNKFVKKRKYIANFYNKKFQSKSAFTIPHIESYSEHSFHIYPLKINFKNLKICKKVFFQKLLKNKINLQVHYIPIHLQKYYRKKFGYKIGDYPNSEKYYADTVSLPIYYQLKKKQLEIIVKKIIKFVK